MDFPPPHFQMADFGNFIWLSNLFFYAEFLEYSFFSFYYLIVILLFLVLVALLEILPVSVYLYLPL